MGSGEGNADVEGAAKLDNAEGEDGGKNEPEVGRGAAAAAAVPRLESPLLARRTADAVGIATPRPRVGRARLGSTSQTPAV